LILSVILFRIVLQNIPAADGLIQEGAELASRTKKSASDLIDAVGDAKDKAKTKLQGKAVT
jgi:hypothetical protein